MYNYHTHCLYCDGKGSVEDYVKAALSLKFEELGFSSHAFFPLNTDFPLSEELMPLYIQDIQESKSKYPNIKILTGLECDFIPNISFPFKYFKEKYSLDFVIGGVHLVMPPSCSADPAMEKVWFIDGHRRETYDEGLKKFYQNNIQKAVTAFWEQTFEMIETQEFNIVAHLDKIKMHNAGRFFREDEKWYEILAFHALDLIAKKGLIVEINTRGIYKGRCPDFYPSDRMLQYAAGLDIPFVISNDAHQPSDLNLLSAEARTRLQYFKIREVRL
jgi:histidinol-phosphatase (PHP family)